ncbi:SDR family oxidoreductase [Virgibacillus sp. NKC19-3]|uniref:SDR family NAD(P)-dependent oxidoreductase n=1 Tax=Virgibacillus saliphilus TaxID=2831674 RepID=UPI001C9A67EA|nr:SDR family NAD(P)-dependent oxidoreductase [Virgibacillus sp. NKC19-3]MBY7144409.1 SDR family oxidoreductase [Virgibacillus sp. NKC19-3]
MANHNAKVAIVTGAASGIGYAITERLLKEGASVVGADLNEDRLSQLEQELGEHFVGLKMDVTKEADHEALVSKTISRFGKLDYAFNVAGASKAGTITDLSETDWKFTVDLVLNGVFLGMKHQAGQMKKQGSGGAIVNVSSLNAQVPMYTGSAYASAKAGVEMLTKNGALELARHNIRVNTILPGLVDTPLTEGFNSNEEIKDAFLERIPMNRAADPKEMAGPALFLVSEDASYINGASLLVDGAWAVSGYPDLSQWS